MFDCRVCALGNASRDVTRVSSKDVPKSVLQECPTRVSDKSVSHKSDLQENSTAGVSHESVLREYPTRVTHKSVPQKCPRSVSHESVPQESSTRVSYKSFLQGIPTRVLCPTGVFRKSVPQECPRVSHKRVLQECFASCPAKVGVIQQCPAKSGCHTTVPHPREYPAKLTHKNGQQECPTRLFGKSVLQECPTRVSFKSVPQECPTRASHKSVLQERSARASHKSECHTRCPTRAHKSVQQGFPQRMRPTRVSHKSLSYKSVKILWAFVFEYVFAFGFVGSSSFFAVCFRIFRFLFFLIAGLPFVVSLFFAVAFSRMRSEGFSFNSGGLPLFATRCF